MSPPKIFWSAAVFALILISAGFLIGQTNSLIGQAQVNHITGTIVLTDREDIDSVTAPISLPGTTCTVDIMHCFGGSYVQNNAITAPNLFRATNTYWTQFNRPGIGNVMEGGMEYVSGGYPVILLPSSNTTDTRCMGRHYNAVSSGTYYIFLAHSFDKPGPLTDPPMEIANPTPDAGVAQHAYYLAVSYDCT
ncbi:MAG: hypothetical protein JW772_01850 [Candidatus Diapherotrites archaeon]|nr:hypothetical protein [Candidatus Diapherotrites archaeon]